MFENLLRRLVGPGPRKLPEPDVRLALAALMVRVARADGRYDAAEAALIERLLGRRFGLDAEGARALRAEAETLEREAPDTVRFTRAIKDAVPHEERAKVVAALWAVVLEDGVRDHEEDGFMRLVANLLGISDRDSAIIRREVEEGTHE